MVDNTRINRKLKLYKADDSNSFGVHLHNEYEIIFIQQGSAQMVINGEHAHYASNSLLAIDPLLNHTMNPMETPYLRYVLLINPNYFENFITDPLLRSIFSVKPNGPINVFALNQDDADFIRNELDAAILECELSKPFCETMVMTALLKILVHLYRNYRHQFPDVSRESEKVLPVKAYIDQHFSDDLTLDNISNQFFINKYHLAHLFKKVTGYSLKQYITLKRISYARELLCLSDKNITQIASECGFNSTSNFIRSFKGTEGETPLGFRKAYQNTKPN